MKKTKQTKAQRIAELERKLMETEAQMAHVYHFATCGILKADRSRTMASGVLVQMTYLGGREVCPPFVLRDGLSDATIAALCADLVYSHDLTVQPKP